MSELHEEIKTEQLVEEATTAEVFEAVEDEVAPVLDTEEEEGDEEETSEEEGEE